MSGGQRLFNCGLGSLSLFFRPHTTSLLLFGLPQRSFFSSSPSSFFFFSCMFCSHQNLKPYLMRAKGGEMKTQGLCLKEAGLGAGSRPSLALPVLGPGGLMMGPPEEGAALFTSCCNRREMHHHFSSVMKRRRPGVDRLNRPRLTSWPPHPHQGLISPR